MGIDAVLRHRDQRGAGAVAVVYGGDDAIGDLMARSRMPVLSRLDPLRTVVLTSSDMPELIAELDQVVGLAGSAGERQYLAAARALAEVCACDRDLELHFGGASA